MRKPYGNKTTELELLKACYILIERINFKRLTDRQFNIRYEDPTECLKKFRERDSEGQYKEYRRIYKKATRYNLKVDDLWE